MVCYLISLIFISEVQTSKTHILVTFPKKLLHVKKQTHTRMQYTQHQKQKKVR